MAGRAGTEDASTPNTGPAVCSGAGEEICPEPEVSYNGTSLEKDKDYQPADIKPETGNELDEFADFAPLDDADLPF